MRKFWYGLLLFVMVSVVPVSAAHAVVFIDFSAYPLDTTSVNHPLVTPDGSLNFFGQVANKLNNVDITGGYSCIHFLKNSIAYPTAEFQFSYDVESMHGFYYIEQGYVGVAQVYIDNTGNTLLGETYIPGDSKWNPFHMGFGGTSFQLVRFYTINANGDKVGDHGAITNVTICPNCYEVIPEPSSMALLGLSLIGTFIAKRRKKFSTS